MVDEEKVVDQPATTEDTGTTAADTAPENASTEGVTEGVNGEANQQGDNQNAAPDSQKDFIGEIPKELEPLKKDLLKKFYSKTRELAEERRSVEKYKNDAETLQQLMGYKPFQDWYNAQKNGTATQQNTQLTEEELEQIRTDPAKLNEYLSKKLETLVEQKFGPQMKSVQEKAEDMEIAKEFSAAEKQYGDEFAMAHESGELDPYYDKGLDFETAYATWKLKNNLTSNKMNTSGEKAAQMVNRSKQGMTEKPSSGTAGKLPNIKIVKSKSFDDAFDQAFQAALEKKTVKFEK